MTPQELKNSILQRAFEGKLVQGTDNDLPIKGITLEDDPFDIPERWCWQLLGNCCEMYTGNSISATEKKAKYEGLPEGYDYIATKDVEFDQTISYDNGIKIHFDTTFKIAVNGSVLMCIEGGSAGRKIGILDRDVCFGNKLCTFNSSIILNKYIYYYLQSSAFRKCFSGSMTGIIGGVSIKKLKGIPIPIPPLEEQNCIVEKLEELLPYIDKYEKAWDNLEEYNKKFPNEMQKSILQMAIQGKLVEQRDEEGTAEELYKKIQEEKQKLINEGIIKKQKVLPEISEDEIPFDIPDSWKWVKLANICRTDISYGIIKLGHEDPSGVKVLRCSDVKENLIVDDSIRTVTKDLSDQYSRTILEGNEIVINVRGTLGGCAVVPVSMKGFNVAREVAVVRQCEGINPQYIVYLFMSDYFSKFMFRGLRGIAYKGLNMGILSSLPIPLPPMEEQDRIVSKVKQLINLYPKLI